MFQLPKTLSLLAVASLALPTLAPAQSLTEKRDSKIAAMQEDGWVTDYSEARQRAEREGKVIFVYFTRSYAP